VVVIKIAVLYYFGLYQTVWRHVGVRDFMNILKSLFISSLLIITAILMYERFQYFSRTVFVVDGMLSLLLISGSHFSLRILREYLESQPLGNKRVLLIGAGDAGEMALREIRNNPGLKFKVLGFLDDDPYKQKRRIHGVRVLGKIENVGRVLQATGAQEALIAMPSASGDRLQRILQVCEQQNVSCHIFGSNSEA
jgi:FlaA1/EpsC-like NDP-sugar epimerase